MKKTFNRFLNRDSAKYIDAMIDFLLSTYEVMFSEFVKCRTECIIKFMNYTTKNTNMLLNTENSVI